MLKILLIIFLWKTIAIYKVIGKRGQARNDANGQIINSMGFHPVGQARVIRSIVHLREEANLQPLVKAIKEITVAHAEYKKNCHSYGKTKKDNFVILGRGHREQAREACAQKDMVVAQPFTKDLQKELNTLLNEKSLPFVAIDVTYDLSMQSIMWPLTGQGVWDSFAETFDIADFSSKESLKWTDVYRRYDQLFFYSSNKILVKRTNGYDGLNHISLTAKAVPTHEELIVCMNRHVAINQSLHEQAQENCKKKEREYFEDIANLKNRLRDFVANYVTKEKKRPRPTDGTVITNITATRTKRSLFLYGAMAINLYNYGKRVFRHYQGKREQAALASYAKRTSLTVFRDGDRLFQPYVSELDLENVRQKLASMERYLTPIINTIHQQLASWEEVGNNVMTNNHRMYSKETSDLRENYWWHRGLLLAYKPMASVIIPSGEQYKFWIYSSLPLTTNDYTIFQVVPLALPVRQGKEKIMVKPQIETEFFLFQDGADEYHPLYRSDVRACLNQDCELHHPAISRSQSKCGPAQMFQTPRTACNYTPTTKTSFIKSTSTGIYFSTLHTEPYTTECYATGTPGPDTMGTLDGVGILSIQPGCSVRFSKLGRVYFAPPQTSAPELVPYGPKAYAMGSHQINVAYAVDNITRINWEEIKRSQRFLEGTTVILALAIITGTSAAILIGYKSKTHIREVRRKMMDSLQQYRTEFHNRHPPRYPGNIFPPGLGYPGIGPPGSLKRTNSAINLPLTSSHITPPMNMISNPLPMPPSPTSSSDDEDEMASITSKLHAMSNISISPIARRSPPPKFPRKDPLPSPESVIRPSAPVDDGINPRADLEGIYATAPFQQRRQAIIQATQLEKARSSGHLTVGIRETTRQTNPTLPRLGPSEFRRPDNRPHTLITRQYSEQKPPQGPQNL